MDNVKKEINNEQLIIKINTKIYSLAAIMNSIYWFTDACYIFQKPIKDDTIAVNFKAEANQKVSLNEIYHQFCNELIDQQVRLNLESEFKKIRELIVNKAFASFDKK